MYCKYFIKLKTRGQNYVMENERLDGLMLVTFNIGRLLFSKLVKSDSSFSIINNDNLKSSS